MTLFDHNDYSVSDGDIILKIWGIINPNYYGADDEYWNTGEFKVSITQSLRSNYLLQHNAAAGSLITSVAPKYNDVIFITASNEYSRYEATYTINMTTSSTLPDSEAFGQIFVDFPQDYVLQHSNI